MAKRISAVSTDEELRMELDAAFEAVLTDFDEDGVAGLGLLEFEPIHDFSFSTFDGATDPALALISHNTWLGQSSTTLAGVRLG